MISIITSVHNLIDMNRLFYETLKEKTSVPFELIVIDNNSTDGTREFYKEKADKIILNDANYSYPYCQNQGIKVAKYDYLAFFNNDILVPYFWDKRSIEIVENNDIDVFSFATNDHVESKSYHRKLSRKWKRVKNPLFFLFGARYFNLKLMKTLMYHDFDTFSENRFLKFKDKTIEGFSGSCILMKRQALSKIGMWDEQIQGADFDIFNRVKLRSIEHNDIKPIQLLLGVYIHHFQKLTLKSNYIEFADKGKIIPVKQKWGKLSDELTKDII